MFILFSLLLNALAMPANEFENLRQRVDDASFPKEQMGIITRIPSSSEITCAQMVQLLDELSFSKDQMTAIQHLTPQIKDLKNRHLIIEFLTYSNDKEQAGQILDSAYAEQKDSRQEHRESAKEQGMQQRVKRLKAWAKELHAKEQMLAIRNAELEERERKLKQREQRLRMLEARQGKGKEAKPQGQGLSWVGYCPMGINHNSVARGECLPFDAEHFNPKTKHGQRLLLKVDRPGSIKLRINRGPKLKRCKKVGNTETIERQVLKTTRANQIIDVTDLIDNWNVDYLRITASSKGQQESVRIDDWQQCD